MHLFGPPALMKKRCSIRFNCHLFCRRFVFFDLSVPDEGYSSVHDEGYSSVHDEGYSRSASCVLHFYYWCYLYWFAYIGVHHDFHIRWCSFRLTVTRRVQHVEQELLTLPELLDKWIRVAQSLVFCVMFCRSLSVPLSFFFWTWCCPSSIYRFWLRLWYLRFTESDYAFGILDLRILITHLVS